MNKQADTEPQMFGNLLASRPKREGRSAFAATLTSMTGHGVAIAALVWATMAAGQVVDAEEDVTMLIPIMEEEPPPPPPPPPVVEVKIQEVPTVDVPKGFQTLTIPQIVLPDIPPPKLGMELTERDFTGEGVEGGRSDGNPDLKTVTAEDISAAPRFMPRTVEPELRNQPEVQRALQRSYPPLLRDAGIGGRATVWFFIDETGRVVKTLLNESSGHDALDKAAMEVADIMRFRPAINGDKKVQVWVSIPVAFTSK